VLVSSKRLISDDVSSSRARTCWLSKLLFLYEIRISCAAVIPRGSAAEVCNVRFAVTRSSRLREHVIILFDAGLLVGDVVLNNIGPFGETCLKAVSCGLPVAVYNSTTALLL
jgi:hypothetical protein